MMQINKVDTNRIAIHYSSLYNGEKGHKNG